MKNDFEMWVSATTDSVSYLGFCCFIHRLQLNNYGM